LRFETLHTKLRSSCVSAREMARRISASRGVPDPRWMELREVICPGCTTLLEVEACPPGYPIVHDFQPDLEGFYRDWLGQPL
jgi:acetone carboxylase, gamma subunit